MENFFITGTDTEIGKTYVTCALLRDLRARGLHAMGFKPLACGDRSDPRAMRDAVGEPSLSLDIINPIYLRTPAAPYIAAEMEQRPLSLDEITTAYKQLASQYSPVLVEGAGGWEAPLAPGLTMADLAKALGLPVVLVVGNKLGAVNHAILTVKAIRAIGLECRSIVLNHYGEEWDAASVSNCRLIEEFTGVSVQAELIHGQADINSRAVLGC